MHALPPFVVNVIRLTLWLVLLAAVFVPLERLFALRPAPARRAGAAADLCYYFISSLLPAALLALPISFLALASQKLLPAGWLAWAEQLPWGARFALALVAGDFGAYWGHRWTHQVPWLWRFHALHHSAEQMDWLVNTRAHPIDMVFVRICGLVPLFFLGLAQPSDGSHLAVALAIVTTFWSFLVHANVRWRFGRLEQLVALPAFHHWHHTREQPINRNYAASFPWMDRLFGTLHLPPEWPRSYGIDTPTAAGVHRQLLEPFWQPRPSQSPDQPAGSQPALGSEVR